MEEYRSGHNETDSKSVRQYKLSRGFESHFLRQKILQNKSFCFAIFFVSLYNLHISNKNIHNGSICI